MFKIYDGRESFYQWDTNQKLIVNSNEINEVHFCNRTDDCALVCEVYHLDGLNVVDVPNVLFQTDWNIKVFGYNIDHTEFAQTFKVKPRSKPEDYVYTEEELRTWEELNERIDQIEEQGVSDERIASAVEGYLVENPVEVDLTGYATEQYVDSAITQIELTPGPAGKDGKDGKDGAPGKDGVDGKDYVLTNADKQEIANMVDVPDVDLTDYYTKSETDKKIADAQLSGGDVDLSDYYTKNEVDSAIQNIELTPGPTGPKGEDGKDGYTPVKGVDYFDGAPGKDGKDGADSTVPGPTGPAGADGQDGYTPVKGTDYFTAEEIAQIEANAAAAVDLSSYATTQYVDDAVAGAGGGGSASVAVDNKTIVQDSEGVISTSIGGGMDAQYQGVKYKGTCNYSSTRQSYQTSLCAKTGEQSLSYGAFNNKPNKYFNITVSHQSTSGNTSTTYYNVPYEANEGTQTFTFYPTQYKYKEGNLPYDLKSAQYKVTSSSDTTGLSIQIGESGACFTNGQITITCEYVGSASYVNELYLPYDNKTLVLNENGVITTAIGGSREFASAGLKILNYHDATGVTCKNDSNVNATIPVGVTNYDLAKTYKATVTIKNITNNTTETLTWDMYCQNQSWKEWYVPAGNGYFQYIDIYGTNFRFIVDDPAVFYTTYSITDVVFQEPDVYTYEYIDNNYLNIGSSLVISNEGVLDTTLSNLIGNAQLNSLVQANNNSTTMGTDSAVFGSGNAAQKNYNYVLGTSNSITLANGIAIGQSNIINRPYSIALGEANTLANGNWYGYVMGANNFTYNYEHVYEFGHNLRATRTNNVLLGWYNDTSAAYPFIFGNGTSDDARSNAMTIDTTGNVIAAGTISGAGSDYAEYFEWADGNPEDEDRIGLLVALDGEKIRLANAEDDVLGIVSGTATILGDNAEWHWKGKYVTDNFGRIIYDNVEIFEERNIMDEETGDIIGREPVSIGFRDVPRINPNYDASQEYKPRSERPEWDVIGLMGKLYLQDDGEAKVGDYVAPAADGIATVASGKTNIRVMERVSDNIVRVLLK